ncbi:uncharacterized protein [Periplaneta americana]|uniref:uncharacterized protein isoform X3 n=2 Tax=Periplaneta americana TaxID=6978 RepID=UPI0037E76D5C
MKELYCLGPRALSFIAGVPQAVIGLMDDMKVKSEFDPLALPDNRTNEENSLSADGDSFLQCNDGIKVECEKPSNDLDQVVKCERAPLSAPLPSVKYEFKSYENFLMMNETSTTVHEQVYWNENTTRALIDHYKVFKSKLGTMEIRNMKKLWEILCNKINGSHKTSFTPSQCENRWRVLERNYKKIVDNNNTGKTGRIRKQFIYEDEMADVFGKKRNIQPELSLSSNTVIQEIPTSGARNISDLPIDSGRENSPSTSAEVAESSTPLKKKKTEPRKLILAQMRKDRKEYYNNMLTIEREKLQIQKEKLIERRYKNKLIEERNEILRQYLDYKIDIPSYMC